MSDAATAVAPRKVTDTPAVGLFERLGFRAASGVGEAGWGRTLLAAIVSFIYFFPVLWIILTAFKTYDDVLAVPAKFIFTPTLDNFAQVFSRAYSVGGQAQNTGFALYFFNSIFIATVSISARPHHRHAGRLWFLAVSAEGQRHLSFHHPVDAHAARDRGYHSDLHHVPRHRPRRHLCSASSRSTRPSTCRSRSG